ncbi:hypothetical protein [Saccharopolyspora elongata]|uniref:hypothetical protein n=1 Tax=Saccharopolyspora elongata TaxID=2530387 RepID=UPI00104792D5|nr:hypothetical protein [Saccharopolyspora elongata]
MITQALLLHTHREEPSTATAPLRQPAEQIPQQVHLLNRSGWSHRDRHPMRLEWSSHGACGVTGARHDEAGRHHAKSNPLSRRRAIAQRTIRDPPAGRWCSSQDFSGRSG